MYTELTTFDGIIIFLYLGVILSIGIYFLLKQEAGTDSYFFAGRRMGWLTVGASLFSAQFLLGIVFPMTGSLLSAAVTVMGCMILTLLSMFLVHRLAVHVLAVDSASSVSDTLHRAFTQPLRGYIALVPAALVLLIRLAAVLLFCSYAFEHLLGWDPGANILVIVLFVGFYSIVGGFHAVIVTQAVQAVSVLAGIIMLAAIGGSGVQGLTADLEGLSLLSVIGLFLIMMWSWYGDHYIVQHLIGARSPGDMKKGVTAAVVLNTVCLGAIMLLGMFASDIPGPIDRALQFGWRGIIAAGILSLTMSQLAGLFTSGAAFFTMKIFKPRHQNSSERKLVLVGRLATTSIVIASIVAVMTTRLIGHESYRLLQTAMGMIIAPTAAMICVSVFRMEHTREATWRALAAAAAIGGFRLLLEALVLGGMPVHAWASWFISFHYLSLTAAVFVLTLALLTGRSAYNKI